MVLSTILHGFTHAYSSLLVPLYLLIAADLKLRDVNSAALIVTVYGVVYWGCSYFSGVVADHANRKNLLGIGLIVNAVALVGMGLTRQYEVILAMAVLAGLSGTFFHPAANALVPAHFPRSPGMAIGLLGIGSGLGFFAGPRFAGWRAQSTDWSLGHVSDWQRPCIELGALGVLFGLLFLLLARESTCRSIENQLGEAAPRARAIMTRAHIRRIALIGCILGCRDFAGVAALSLASIFLQKAQGMAVGQTGTILGKMMLLSVIVNPLSVYLTHGHRRLPVLVAVMLLGAATVLTVPFVPAAMTWVALCGFQTCQLASYAISDAGMLERTPADLRGRVVGVFLSIAGTFAATSPWMMGFWTDQMGASASVPRSYAAPFGLLAGLMVFATLSVPLIARLDAYGEDKPDLGNPDIDNSLTEKGGQKKQPSPWQLTFQE